VFRILSYANHNFDNYIFWIPDAILEKNFSFLKYVSSEQKLKTGNGIEKYSLLTELSLKNQYVFHVEKLRHLENL
jgi:hypothetical protein